MTNEQLRKAIIELIYVLTEEDTGNAHDIRYHKHAIVSEDALQKLEAILTMLGED